MLTSDIVAQVRRIQLTTGRQVADVLSGAYQSVFKGRGMEFDEVRPYVPGDDIRTIDWNVTARTGEPFVKRFVEERELTVMLMVDISASQDFGSKSRSKREAAVELSALLAFSAIHNKDKIGLLLFHGQAEEYIPPRQGQKHALRVVREILARGKDETHDGKIENPFDLPRSIWRRFQRLKTKTANTPRKSTNIAHALDFCRKVLPRRVVLFLISDFIDNGYVDVLRSANRRHDVVCSFIKDKRESVMPAAGLISLEDAETGQERLVDTSSRGFRNMVEKNATDRLELLQKEFRSASVDLMQVDATEPVIDPLLAFFRMRERRHRR